MLQAFSAALEQPEDVFEPIYKPAPNQLIKIIRYPGRAAGESDQGVGAHKDSGFMAVLLQDQVAGLQVEGEDGWIDAPPVPGSFIINVGEILEIASGGYLRANVHRVISPPAGHDRLSVAFFLGARLDAEVPVARLAAASGGRGARRDARPSEPALPRGRPQLSQGPAAVASRRRAPPPRRPARTFRRPARTRLGLLTPTVPSLGEPTP